MPGFLLHQGAQVQCSHGGKVTPGVVNPRVKVMGQPIVTMPTPWTVAGCTFPSPPAANGPCATAVWMPPTVALRVRANTQAVLLSSSQATCAPTGTPVMITTTQTRVKGM